MALCIQRRDLDTSPIFIFKNEFTSDSRSFSILFSFEKNVYTLGGGHSKVGGLHVMIGSGHTVCGGGQYVTGGWQIIGGLWHTFGKNS